MRNSHDQRFQRIERRSQQALILSYPQTIQFGTPTQLKRSLLSSLTSLLKTPQKQAAHKKIIPVPNQIIIMAHGNIVRLYRYWQSLEQQLNTELLAELELPYYIKEIKVSPSFKSLKGKGFYLVVEASDYNMLELLYYTSSIKLLQRFKMQRISSAIYCWSFIENKEILIWAADMKIHHYEIKHQGLKLVRSIDTGINLNQQLAGQNQTSKSLNKSKTNLTQLNKGKQIRKDTKKFSLEYCVLLGMRGKEQDSLIVLFYVLYCIQKNDIKIKCKEILYPLQTQVSDVGHGFLRSTYSEFPTLKMMPQLYQIISSRNPVMGEALKKMRITQIGDSYMVRFQSELIIIQKKFDQYYAMDNAYKKSHNSKLVLAQNSNTIAFITDNIIQINRIQVIQNKAHSELIDFIDLKSEFQKVKEDQMLGTAFIQNLKQIIKRNKNNKSNNETNTNQLAAHQGRNKVSINFSEIMKDSKIIQMWITVDPLHQQHRSNICFIFQSILPQNNDKKLFYELFITKHTSLIKKLTKLGHNSNSIGQLQNIQKFGEGLGVNQNQFYFNMWKSSKQGNQQILSFLLKCKNYKKILPELRSFIRKKSFPIAKLLKVLSKLQSITLQILKQKLNEQFLVDYFHVIFVHRKFQIYQSNYAIDERQFVQTLEISLYDLIKKIINNTLFPQSKKTSLWMMQPKEPPKLNIIQVLDLFKLPLLEQYGEFLKKIFSMNPTHIIQIIDHFTELLPQYPFTKYHIIKRNSLATVGKNYVSKKQKQFFSAIKEQDMLAQPNFLQNTLRELYAYYSTSVIEKHFEMAMRKPSMISKKYYLHTAVQSNFATYKQKIESVTAQSLYIIALECEIMQAYQRRSKSNLKILCKKMHDHYGIDKSVINNLEVAASLFELMITYQIINPQQICLRQIYEEPIQKWITLFFLGNKQQKDLIFTQFIQIFNTQDQFIQALKKFISSEHCSKIQLSFLIDLITHRDENFQRENQKIIDVIIDGFFQRVEISDTPDSNHFMDRIRTIQLNPNLLIKVDKIEKMKLCKRIFAIFYMDDLLVKDIMYNIEQVIQKMLQIFFKKQIKQSKIAISKGNYIDIDYNNVDSMFELLCFLRQTIFFQLKAERMVVIYCKKLLEWQAFEQVEDLIYNSNFMKNFDSSSIVEQIQKSILQQVYQDTEIEYEEQIEGYIQRILALERSPNLNSVVIQQRAKIELANIFKELGYSKKLVEINQMLIEWQQIEQQANNDADYGEVICRKVMNRIIYEYKSCLDAITLERIYKCFLLSSTLTLHPDTRTNQFYHYCFKLAGFMLEVKRLKEASQIICISNQRYEMNYWLMSQCLLTSLIKIYVQKDEAIGQSKQEEASQSAHDSSLNILKVAEGSKNIHHKNNPIAFLLEKANIISKKDDSVNSQWVEQQADSLTIVRRYIDYFVANWASKNEEAMKKIFSCFFSDNLAQEEQQLSEIQVNRQLCFKQHLNKISSIFIWNIIEEICLAENIERNHMVYAYFFMRMGITNPNIGFAQIDYINYEQSILFTVLTKFKQKCDTLTQLFFLDYSVIFKIYLDAITNLLTILHKEESQSTDYNESKEKSDIMEARNELNLSKDRGKPNLKVVRDLVKKGLYKQDPLTSIINKMSTLTVQAIKNSKKREIDYISLIDIRKLDFTKAQREFNLQKKLSKIGQHYQDILQKQKQEQKGEEQISMMSFDQFKKMKIRIKNDKSLTLSLNNQLDLTDKMIVQETFNQMGIDCRKIKNFCLDSNPKKIPGLQQLILQSLKQMQNSHKQKQQGDEPQVLGFQGDSQKAVLNVHDDTKVLFQSLKQENYTLINNWSAGAILIQTDKIYLHKQVKFHQVIKMFHELCVANNNKIDVLWIAEPAAVDVCNQILKEIFTIQQLRQDFPSVFSEFQTKILNKVYNFILELGNNEIRLLANYFKDISKIQFKTISNWMHLFALLRISILVDKKQILTFQQKQQKLNKTFQLYSTEQLIKNQKQVHKILEMSSDQQLVEYAKEAIKELIRK